MKYRNFGIERDGKMAVTTLLKIENKIEILLENPMANDKDQTKGVEFLLKQESDFQGLHSPE